MKKFRISKRFWLVFLALIGIGLFVWFFWFSGMGILNGEGWPGQIPSKELKGDKSEPSSQIKLPLSGSWQDRDFPIETLDEDLETGLDNGSCQYKVLSYEIDGTEHSSGWQKRKCNSFSLIGVGEETWCRFQGEKACWVFISSRDKANNLHLPSEEKGSVKYYHIDWTGPEVGEVLVEENKIQVRVTDNLKIVACSLYLDNENLGPMSFLVPGCKKECTVLKDLDLEFKPGESRLWVVCQDAAGNYGRGEEFLVKENLPPQISSCRVIPTQGNLQTNFQFKIEANDPDEDQLTFLWDFGDSQNSEEKNPSHSYSQVGTYEPKVKVSDGKGGEDSCSTAWVVVNE